MKQRWRKMGLVFCPSGEHEWMYSHAAVPIAEPLGGDLFKVYFSSRDRDNKSYTGFVVIDITCPQQIIEVSSRPVLRPGQLGEFDDSGAMATWLATWGGKKYLYYIGWNLGKTVPFRNSIGLAVGQPSGDFSRFAPGPVVDRTMREPHFCASCCVVPGKDKWRMWYLSCTGWTLKEGHPEHHYHIKYAESEDGIEWVRDGAVSIDFASQDEYAISRPSVIQDDGRWRMWYSFRGEHYRIGYAESINGRDWQRLDHEAGIDASNEGWDSQMIEYPFVFDHKGKRYMLYNGNDYGRAGFGLAVLEQA